ncbi:MAG: hypothetical protein QOG48_1411, partial [Verrucomicrobiota bacterium]
IFVGNGDGSFQPLAQQYDVGDAAFAMEAVDLNGDSIVDLAVVSANFHYVSILEGNGKGTFNPATNYGVSKGPTQLAVADFNGDGKPDVITTGFWLEKVSTLLNTTPIAPPVQLLSVVSRKVHGSVGQFDVDLPPNGSGIEGRSGHGDYTLVFTFADPLTSVDSANVSSGTASIGSATISADPHQFVVNLTGVSNAQRLSVSLNNVTSTTGEFSASVPVIFSILVGDTTQDGFVNSGDIGQTKSQSGIAVSNSNFREDVTADGDINSADIALVKSKSGTALP